MFLSELSAKSLVIQAFFVTKLYKISILRNLENFIYFIYIGYKTRENYVTGKCNKYIGKL